MPSVRNADRHDAPELAQVAERTFRATFGAQNTAENMDLHCRLHYAETIQTNEISALNMATLLAVDGGN